MSPQQNPKKKYNQFEAVILAGGRGSRLSPLTDFCPKPLLKVKGNSLLEYITDEVNFCGIDNISRIVFVFKAISCAFHQYYVMWICNL